MAMDILPKFAPETARLALLSLGLGIDQLFHVFGVGIVVLRGLVARNQVEKSPL
jgi:hypothetical protein